MEKQRLRKLLQLYGDVGAGDGTLPPASLSRQREPMTTVENATSSAAPPSKSPSALDSSMALTIFVLLIALFFMGFFSVYIRHFADDSTAEISSRPRRRSSRTSPRGPSPSVSLPFGSRKGLDSQAVRSLPVYRYTQGAKQRIEDCAICLSDFEYGEAVKVIPYCGHVFHVSCVDTWLSSHVSCPFCRSSQLFSEKAVVGRWREPSDRGSTESRHGSTVENGDTCTLAGSSIRRCSSCSSLGQRPGLERSLSF